MIEIQQIESSRESPSSFQVNLTIPRAGRKIRGLLTREMLTGLNQRSVVLLPEEAIKDCLGREETDALQGLHEIAHRMAPLGRLATSKEIVVGLFKRHLHYEKKCVLVHRFGPVPGVLIKTNAISPIDGEPINLGVYLKFNESFQLGRKPSSSSLYVLQALQHSPEIIFQRYFEDVGELLQSICGRADLTQALWWANTVQNLLGESVKSKLREVFAASKRSGSHELAQILRNEHPYTFLKAAFARNLFLYLLNVFYGTVGVWSSPRYAERLINFRNYYSQFFASHIIEDAFDLDPVLSDLEGIFEAFEETMHSGRSVDFRTGLASGEKWVRQTSDFANFVCLLRVFGTPSDLDPRRTFEPTVAKIFFSAHHSVPVAQEVRKQLHQKTIDDTSTKPEIQLLYVREGQRVHFRSVIKGRIWLSDGLLAVIPVSTQKYSGSSADYKWIGEESAAALGLRKEVLFAIQDNNKGRTTSEVQRQFSNVQGEIFNLFQKEDLSKELVEAFMNRVNPTFHVSAEGTIDDEFVREFRRFSKSAYECRTNQLIQGFLKQLPESVFVNLKSLRCAGSGESEVRMDEILRRQKDANAKPIRFVSLFKQARTKRLVINNQERYLMTKLKANERGQTSGRVLRYCWNLTRILEELRPFATHEEIKTWEDNLIAWTSRPFNRGNLLRRAT